MLTLNPSNNFATAIKTLLQQHDPDVRVDFPYTVRTHEHRIGMHLRYAPGTDWRASAWNMAASIGMGLDHNDAGVWRLVKAPERQVSTQPPPHMYRPRKGVRVQARQVPPSGPDLDKQLSAITSWAAKRGARATASRHLDYGSLTARASHQIELRDIGDAVAGDWIVHGPAGWHWQILTDSEFQALYRAAAQREESA